MKMRIGCLDLVSNTCFPVLAAEELGFYRAEGLDTHVELLRAPGTFAALRDGTVDAMAAGSVHGLLRFFPLWEGAKLVVAIAQGAPWLLVVRADLPANRGDMDALRGLRLTAAPGPDLVLRQLLIAGGLDPERDVQIVPVPGSDSPNPSGVIVARALEEGQVDGFWANAMGSETIVQRGVGKILIDARRGDGPSEARHFTFAALTTTEELIARDPECVAAAVRAIVKTQQALRADPTRATEVGKRRFPPDAAELIATLVERDLPFYDPAISEEAVAGLNRFAQSVGLVPGPVPYEQVVAVRFRDLWRS